MPDVPNDRPACLSSSKRHKCPLTRERLRSAFYRESYIPFVLLHLAMGESINR